MPFGGLKEPNKLLLTLKKPSPPVLALPNFALPFVIESDALTTRIGAVLAAPNYLHESRVEEPEKIASTNEREMLGIMFAIKKWRHYLLDRESIIKTDHKTLKNLLEQRHYTEAQHSCLLKLHNYRFVVDYKKGKENLAANSLSRSEEAEGGTFLMANAVETYWVDQVRAMLQNDCQRAAVL